jgi:hypothetical protein
MQYHQKASQGWRGLSSEVQENWNNYALNYPEPQKKDPTKFLSGFQLFVKRNYYIFLHSGISSDFMTEPVSEIIMDPEFTVEISASGMCLDISEFYIKNFGLLPATGDSVICRVVPMAVDSGQFFSPYIATLIVDNVYIDGLFLSLNFVGNPQGVEFSIFLSKPVRAGRINPGTTFRYMGCFKPTKFVQLSDTPDEYTGHAGKFVAVNDEETALEFIEQSEMSEEMFEARCGHIVYDENSEWNAVASSTSIETDNTDNPYNKSTNIRANSPSINNDITFISPVEVPNLKYPYLIVYVYLHSAFVGDQDLTILFINEDEHCSDEISLGVDDSLLNQWQACILDISTFTFDLDSYTSINIIFRAITATANFPIIDIDYVALIQSNEAPDCTCFCQETGGSEFDCEDLLECDIITTMLTALGEVAGSIIPEIDQSIPEVSYGLLYNKWAAINSLLPSSADWSCPTTAIWTALQSYLTAQGYTGNDLKEDGIVYWSNSLGLNTLLFFARGAGSRDTLGVFDTLKRYNSMWASDYPGDETRGRYFYLYTGSGTFSYGNTSTQWDRGYSVRLCRPAPGVADGTVGFYTGNNGRSYRTTVINEVEWLADNLAETMFNDKTLIPYIADATAWGSATASAYCFPAGNKDNV